MYTKFWQKMPKELKDLRAKSVAQSLVRFVPRRFSFPSASATRGNLAKMFVAFLL